MRHVRRTVGDAPYWNNSRQELDHLLRVAPRAVEEVQPILHLFHRDRVLLRAVLEDELLEEQERPLVRNLLPDLHESLPGVLRGQLRAVGALAVLNKELDLKDLLQDRRGQDLLLNGEGNS